MTVKQIVEDHLKKVLNNTNKETTDNKNNLMKDTGVVFSISDQIARSSGLSNAYLNECVTLHDQSSGKALVKGVIVDLDIDNVSILLLENADLALSGMTVKKENTFLKTPVGEDLIGRIVDGYGNIIDGKKDLETKNFRDIMCKAPGVHERKNVNRALLTGYQAIDAAIPIGKGQRELIIGDRQLGKTTIAKDVIINQKNKNVYCVYVSIGQKNSSLASLNKELEEAGAMKYTTIVSASASSIAAMQYLAPFTGCAIAEYFRDNGKDALIIYDDLSKHATAYRQINLILRRPPGREAYPADMFYIHAKLLERAAQLSEEKGGGSLTALPIIETQGGDISGFIPTNVISITDGQIFLSTDLFNQGIKPAVNLGLSVSRVGGDAQSKTMKAVSGKLKLVLSQYQEIKQFAQFSSDLNEDTMKQLKLGEVLVEILKQYQGEPLAESHQIIFLYLGLNGILNNLKLKQITLFKKEFINFILKNKNNNVLDKINNHIIHNTILSQETIEELNIEYEKFLKENSDFVDN